MIIGALRNMPRLRFCILRLIYAVEIKLFALSRAIDGIRLHLLQRANSLDPVMHKAPPPERGFVWRPTYQAGRIEPLWFKYPILGRKSGAQHRPGEASDGVRR